MELYKILQNHFHEAQSLINKNIGLQCLDFKPEVESQEYGACSFTVDGRSVRFRVAKITPTKIGQFVTFWKRIGTGPIMPFDGADGIDFFMVSVRKDNHCGLFIFPQAVLLAKDVISKNGKGGKRAIRVYPSWDVTDSKQAQATQAWQVRYFIHIEQDGSCDQVALKKLLQVNA